jgi:hypothetical protein
MLLLVKEMNDMGLDNIPKRYPCIDVAVKDQDGRIDCIETQSCGKCTWENESKSNPMLAGINPVLGMFGTSCWYRGKYGNYLLRLLEGIDSNDYKSDTKYSFYGGNFPDGEEGISPDECLEMSKYMKDNTEKFAYQARQVHPDEEKEYISDWIYASWWLEFAGKHCNGSAIWY